MNSIFSFKIAIQTFKDNLKTTLILTGLFGIMAVIYSGMFPSFKDLLEQLVEKHYATTIINELLPVMEGNKSGVLHNVRGQVDTYISMMRNPPRESVVLRPCDLSVAQMVDQEVNFTGIGWNLNTLNETIGGVRRGTLGLVYAFVDSGKTSFGLSCVASFAQQLMDTGDTIVYAGNEESASRTSFRLTQAILGQSRLEIADDIEGAERRRRELGYNRVKVLDAVTHVDHVRMILDEWHPYVLVIDQATKVGLEANRNTNEVGVQRELFNWYREAAKEYQCAILGLAQGVGEAENKKYLNLSDIYGSRVGIQGELDYAIGIGRLSDDARYDGIRFIHVSKNKMLDGQLQKFQVFFDHQKCMWTEV